MNELQSKISDRLKARLAGPRALHFRNQLRQARAATQRDAEDFDDLLFAIERLGSHLSGARGALADYATALNALASSSVLARRSNSNHQISFGRLYELVREARNDALHQGEFARHLAQHAIELALILEDALMTDNARVVEYMVKNPQCAEPWQPLSSVRQTMLANSFSYLPYLDGQKRWRLIADSALVRYLRAGTREDRDARLLKSVEDACRGKQKPAGLKLIAPSYVITDHKENISSVLPKFVEDKPILVVDEKYSDRLLGLLTPFDLL